MFVFALPIVRLKGPFHEEILKSGLNVTFSIVCMFYSPKNIEVRVYFVKIFHKMDRNCEDSTLYIVGIFFSYIILLISYNTKYIRPLSKKRAPKRTLTSIWCFYSLFTPDLCSMKFPQKIPIRPCFFLLVDRFRLYSMH